MDPQRWQKVKALFAEVADLPWHEQKLYLQQHPADKNIRLEVLRMIKAESDQLKGLSTIMLESAKELVGERELLNPGDRLGVYEIKSLIGEGESAAVYLAHRIDKHFEQKVAVKFFRQPLENDSLSVLLKQEKYLLGQLDHPNIARIVDVGINENNHLYVVSEFVDGNPIDEYCRQNKLSLDQCVELMCDVCQAIQYANQKGIIHRNIKPANILISEVDGEEIPKVVDFGFTQALQDEGNQLRVVSKPHASSGFKSPEQFLAGDTSTQSDVYSLGLTLYELLCDGITAVIQTNSDKNVGEKWQVLPSPNDYLKTLSPKDKKKLSVTKIPPELDHIITKACAVNLSDRYQSVYELTSDLRAFQQGLPVKAFPQSKFHWFRKNISQHPVVMAMCVLAVFGMLGIGVVSTKNFIDKQKQIDQLVAQANNNKAISEFLTATFAEIKFDSDQASIEEVFSQAAQRIEADYSSQPLVQAKLYSVIGESEYKLGQYQKAQDLLTLAIKIYRKELGEFDQNTLSTQNLIGLNMLGLRQTEQAIDLYLQLVGSVINRFGENSIFTLSLYDSASRYFNAALQTNNAAKQEELLSILEDGLKQRIKKHGKNSFEVVAARDQLALLYKDGKNYQRSESLYRENLTIQLESLGEAQPETLLTMSKLADTLKSNNQMEDALQLSRRSVNGLLEIQGSQHEDTQKSRLVLFQILVALNSDSRAKEVLADLNPFLHESPESLKLLDFECFNFYQQFNRVAAQAME